MLKLLCQNQSVDQVQLWALAFDPKRYRYLTVTILHLCMKYESCTLRTTQVIVSEPKCWQTSVVTLTFDLKMYRCLPLTILHLCMKYGMCTLKTIHVIVSGQNVDKSSVVTLTVVPQNVKVSSSLHPASMYETWKLCVENYLSYRFRNKVLIKFSGDLDLWPQNV